MIQFYSSLFRRRVAYTSQKFRVEGLKDGEANSSTTKAPINLSQYIHAVGSRASTDDVQTRFKFDYELFANKLRNVRGWGPKQVEAEWLKLKADPRVKKDENGRHHAVHGTLRIHVPPDLIGEDCEQERKGTFEERRVDNFHKACVIISEGSVSIGHVCKQSSSLVVDCTWYCIAFSRTPSV